MLSSPISHPSPSSRPSRHARLCQCSPYCTLIEIPESCREWETFLGNFSVGCSSCSHGSHPWLCDVSPQFHSKGSGMPWHVGDHGKCASNEWRNVKKPLGTCGPTCLPEFCSLLGYGDNASSWNFSYNRRGSRCTVSINIVDDGSTYNIFSTVSLSTSLSRNTLSWSRHPLLLWVFKQRFTLIQSVRGQRGCEHWRSLVTCQTHDLVMCRLRLGLKALALARLWVAQASPNHELGPKPKRWLGLAWLWPRPGLMTLQSKQID